MESWVLFATAEPEYSMKILWDIDSYVCDALKQIHWVPIFFVQNMFLQVWFTWVGTQIGWCECAQSSWNRRHITHNYLINYVNTHPQTRRGTHWFRLYYQHTQSAQDHQWLRSHEPSSHHSCSEVRAATLLKSWDSLELSTYPILCHLAPQNQTSTLKKSNIYTENSHKISSFPLNFVSLWFSPPFGLDPVRCMVPIILVLTWNLLVEVPRW